MVFRIDPTGMFALCSWHYDSIDSGKSHVERDGVLGEGSKGMAEYNTGSVVPRKRGLAHYFLGQEFQKLLDPDLYNHNASDLHPLPLPDPRHLGRDHSSLESK